MALRRAGLVKHVVGYSKSPSTTDKARRMGVIDQTAKSALLAVSGSDIVLMAVPVAASEATFRAILPLIEPGVLLMDVGSTKRDVVYNVVESDQRAASRALEEARGYSTGVVNKMHGDGVTVFATKASATALAKAAAASSLQSAV